MNIKNAGMSFTLTVLAFGSSHLTEELSMCMMEYLVYMECIKPHLFVNERDKISGSNTEI